MVYLKVKGWLNVAEECMNMDGNVQYVCSATFIFQPEHLFRRHSSVIAGDSRETTTIASQRPRVRTAQCTGLIENKLAWSGRSGCG